MEIVIDADGTCFTHEYPRIGKDIGAVPVLKKLINNGHKLILFTMRSGDTLEEAVQWFMENGIPLYGIQKNPTQQHWTTSPKAYGQLIIDDAALGCPLLQDFRNDYGEHTTWAEHIDSKQITELIGRPYVDWERVEKLLIRQGIIKPKTEENV